MATFDADDAQRLLRRFRERRAAIVERIVTGACSPDNVIGGYRALTGRVNELDACIQDVIEIFGS